MPWARPDLPPHGRAGRAALCPEVVREKLGGQQIGSARLQPAPGRCVFQLKGDLLCSPWEHVSPGRPPEPQGSPLRAGRRQTHGPA